MSLVQDTDGTLMDVAIAPTATLTAVLGGLRSRLGSLPPTGDEHRWVSQEIEII